LPWGHEERCSIASISLALVQGLVNPPKKCVYCICPTEDSCTDGNGQRNAGFNNRRGRIAQQNAAGLGHEVGPGFIRVGKDGKKFFAAPSSNGIANA